MRSASKYITHLEFDIAERDRLLDAIRTDLTSTQSENQALRKEVEALKQALLAGRSGAVELPPPKELVSVQESERRGVHLVDLPFRPFTTVT
ncbi:hypothetical protein K525DRAFT_273047 [Schizophyllum commune Loenen D]|nr:hypothetical protein K525DRAFT_273047 [Schizophyllum commune Loenen D]